MATLRKRAGKWQARVKRIGHPPQSKTFSSKQEAEVWARKVESGMDVGVGLVSLKKIKISVGELLTRYLSDVTPRKKGAQQETFRLKRIIRDESICKYQCANMTSEQIATYRDHRLAQVSATTVRLELALFSHAFNTGIREWGLNIINPVALIKLPTPNKARSRRLTSNEFDKLLIALDCKTRDANGTYSKSYCRNPLMKPLVVLAAETAMRQSELLITKWADVDLENAFIMLHDSKNGEARLIPLTKVAVYTLGRLKVNADAFVFPMTASAVKQSFVRAVNRSEITDFHFHDLRHEATSRLAEKLSNVLELSAVTGHKDLRMLKRYYHPRIADLVKKIN